MRPSCSMAERGRGRGGAGPKRGEGGRGVSPDITELVRGRSGSCAMHNPQLRRRPASMSLGDLRADGEAGVRRERLDDGAYRREAGRWGRGREHAAHPGLLQLRNAKPKSGVCARGAACPPHFSSENVRQCERTRRVATIRGPKHSTVRSYSTSSFSGRQCVGNLRKWVM